MSKSVKTTSDLPFTYTILAGAGAGISELLCLYPLDLIKTRMQLATKSSGAQYKGTLDAFSKIIKNEGFLKLYSGISSPIAMEAFKRATKFWAQTESSKLIVKNVYGGQIRGHESKVATLSGLSAGIIESFVVTPFELVKVRLQDVNSTYKGPVDVLKRIVYEKSPATSSSSASFHPLKLFNGLEATMWRHGLWNMGYFSIIFQCRTALNSWHVTKDNKKTNSLISGCVGGAVGSVMSTPFDVAKSRIQNAPKGSPLSTKWTLKLVLEIYQKEGFRSLYLGFTPKVLRYLPGGGILLVAYDQLMGMFLQFHQA